MVETGPRAAAWRPGGPGGQLWRTEHILRPATGPCPRRSVRPRSGTWHLSAVGWRQDHIGRGPAGGRGRAHAARFGGRRFDGVRFRRGRDSPAALGEPGAGVVVAQRDQGEPDRHTRLRRFCRRVARGSARRRLRTVRHRGQRDHRRAHQDPVAGVQRGPDAAGRGDHQTRPSARQLRRGPHRGPGSVRRQGRPVVLPGRRRRELQRCGGPAHPHVLRLQRRHAHRAAAGRLPRCGHRRTARLPHRGRDRGVRGRDAHGALPRRRGDRRGRADRRPGEGRGACLVLPGDPGVQPVGGRHARTSRHHQPWFPRSAGTSAAGGVHATGRPPASRCRAIRTDRCWPRW